MTLAQLVKQKGYATAIYGKWHLGDFPDFLPTKHGFDEWFGQPYSQDMWPWHPVSPKIWPDLPLMEGTAKDGCKRLEWNPDLTQLTTWYTQHAVKFIEQHKDGPFFLYVPHNMPHVPLFVSDKFRGKTKRGRYGDVMREVDWSIGQILDTLDRLGLAENTLVIYASDNGPWLRYGTDAGRAYPLREGKGTVWDGGQRVPCIMRSPGKIPADTVCNEPAMTIDLLPTIAKQIGATLPDHTIDGADIWPLIVGKPNAHSPHEAYFFYYHQGDLEAMRSGRWKLHFPHGYRTLSGRPGGTGGTPVPYDQAKTELALFDLEKDLAETQNVASAHPDVVARLKKLADAMRHELGDRLQKVHGTGVREPGRLKKAS